MKNEQIRLILILGEQWLSIFLRKLRIRQYNIVVHSLHPVNIILHFRTKRIFFIDESEIYL